MRTLLEEKLEQLRTAYNTAQDTPQVSEKPYLNKQTNEDVKYYIFKKAKAEKNQPKR